MPVYLLVVGEGDVTCQLKIVTSVLLSALCRRFALLNEELRLRPRHIRSYFECVGPHFEMSSSSLLRLMNMYADGQWKSLIDTFGGGGFFVSHGNLAEK